MRSPFWYIAIIARLQDAKDFEFIANIPAPDDRQSIVTHIAVVADAAKRWKFYGAEPTWSNVNYSLGMIYNGIAVGAQVTLSVDLKAATGR